MLFKMINGTYITDNGSTIWEHANFEVKETEKIAIVGRNGCGKTTLLKMLAGELELTKCDGDNKGYIKIDGTPDIGYLSQMTFPDDSITVQEEIEKVFQPVIEIQKKLDILLKEMEKKPSAKNLMKYNDLYEKFIACGGYNFSIDYDTMFTKFGFRLEDRKKQLKEFSGGERTKIAFIKLLLSKPDILLLDEPTNHIDVNTLDWLENYLVKYPGAVVLVSHDRYFLDKIVNVVFEIEYREIKRYAGNYSDFIKQKDKDWEVREKKYKLQQKEIKRLKGQMERFKNKPTMVLSIRAQLNRILENKICEPRKYDAQAFRHNFTCKQLGGKDVLRVNELKVGYDQILLETSFNLRRGQVLGIVGGNGSGKSTLLKVLNGLQEPIGGEYEFGHEIDIGYFEQDTVQYNSGKNVIDDFWEEFPNLKRNEIRSALAAFLFTEDEVFKQVDMLSGGEKVRLALAKLLKKSPNLLILDEPTNHMDMIGRETIESMIRDFEGTVLLVSHDRYFLSRTVDSILEIDEGKTVFYNCGYEEYRLEIEKKQTNEVVLNKEKKCKETRKKKNNSIQKIRKKKEVECKKIEEMILNLEKKIDEKKKELGSKENICDYIKLVSIQGEIDKLEQDLDKLYEEWNCL